MLLVALELRTTEQASDMLNCYENVTDSFHKCIKFYL